MSSIFQNPLFAPLEQAFMQIMSTFNKLKNTAKKLLKSISYNDNNSSQGLLPPNLRIILTPQSWPQGLDKDACQKIDKEEQQLWEDTLRKIFLLRQNFLRSCHNDYSQQINKYSTPDSLQEIILTELPKLSEHPDYLQFLVEQFTEKANSHYTTSMEEETTSSSISASSSSSTATTTTSPLVTDLTDTATTRELLSLVTSLTAEMKDLKKTFGAGKTGIKSSPTSLPAREKPPKQPKRQDIPAYPTMPFSQPSLAQQPYGYQYQQYHQGQAIPYPGQPTPYPAQHSPYPVQQASYPYPPMNGTYNQYSNFSPPLPQHPPQFFAPTRDTGGLTVPGNRGKTSNSKVRFSKS